MNPIDTIGSLAAILTSGSLALMILAMTWRYSKLQ